METALRHIGLFIMVGGAVGVIFLLYPLILMTIDLVKDFKKLVKDFKQHD